MGYACFLLVAVFLYTFAVTRTVLLLAATVVVCPISQKSQNTTNLFLRRIFRRSTNSYTLHEFEGKNPVQTYRSIIHNFVRSNWHLDASDVFTDCSAILTRALAPLLLLKTITLTSWDFEEDSLVSAGATLLFTE